MFDITNGIGYRLLPIATFAIFAIVISIAASSPQHPVRSHNLRNAPEKSPPATADIDDFSELIVHHRFVDKSGLLKDFLERYDSVSRVVRPKGWGKSTNLDMMRTFLEMEVNENGEPLPEDRRVNRKLFVGGKVSSGGKTVTLKPLEVARSEDTMKQQGAHPVLSIRLKNVVGSSYREITSKIAGLMANEYKRRSYLKDDLTSSSEDERKFDSYARGGGQDANYSLAESLTFLRTLLNRRYNRSVIILVDDYDTPLNSLFFNLVEKIEGEYRMADGNRDAIFDRAYNSSDFRETFEFFRSWFERCLEGGSNVLNFLLLTGIFHVPFSNEPGGLNDIVGYSVQDRDLSDYYGFDEREVDKLVDGAPFGVDRDSLRRWYGYDFGGKKLYRPWSIRHFLANRGRFGSYWTEQEEWSLAYRLLSLDPMQEPLLHWTDETTVGEWIDEFVPYDNMTDWCFSYLLFSGYLNPSCVSTGSMGLSVPNREVKEHLESILASIVRSKFGVSEDRIRSTSATLASIDVYEFVKKLGALLPEKAPFPSIVYYKELMKCLTLYLENEYAVRTDHHLLATGDETDGRRPCLTLISKYGKNANAIFVDYVVSEETGLVEQDFPDKLEKLLSTLERKVSDIRMKQFNDIRKVLKLVLIFYHGNQIGSKYEINTV